MYKMVFIGGMTAALVAAFIFTQQPATKQAERTTGPIHGIQKVTPLQAGEPAPIKPLGEPALLVAESATPIRRATPEDVLAGLLDARVRQDFAYLARLQVSTTVKPQLDHLDTDKAQRDFGGPDEPRTWDKVKAASDAGTITWTFEADRAVAVVPAGPALGSITLHFTRKADGWHIDLGQ